KRIHLLKRGIFRRSPLSGQCLLDIAKAALEFGIRSSQCRFRVNAQMAGKIADHEQKIAKLLLHAAEVACLVNLMAQLGDLFIELGEYRPDLIPIEPDTRG